ncbi:hypothetical protein BJY00DRAFT_327145 [Aspergillus carlsbadensis]|nr:hypothetical protein BJY00DRAFT_327145 [Aspergillus carlsbadensis]
MDKQNRFVEGQDDQDEAPPPGALQAAKRQRPLPSHATTLPTLQHSDYTIAWICALPLEMAAAVAMLDQAHASVHISPSDTNTYRLGAIAAHNVVITCLPATQYGTNNAANVATNLRRIFPSIRVGLMVGIGGGVPDQTDIRLGDVVVGTRIMQYDLGKVIRDGELQRTAFSRFPDHLLSTAVSSIRAVHELQPSQTSLIMQQRLSGYPGFARPASPDRLFEAEYEHPRPASANCDDCDESRLVPRSTRPSNDPVIHYGAIASGNQVMRSGTVRTRVGQQLGVICLEMEAAGLMDILPCLPIRGICDYSDSHKNKEWQRCAAGHAAAYAREFLGELRTDEHATIVPPPVHGDRPKLTPEERRQKRLGSLQFDRMGFRINAIKPAYGRTCEWFLRHPDYIKWLNPEELRDHHGFLWINGKPGSGKSTILKFMYSDMLRWSCPKTALCASFFFNARGESLEKSVSGMHRSLLHQLLEGYSDLQTVLDHSELRSQDPTQCPSLAFLKVLFFNAVTALGPRSFTCFIDALDECDEQQIVEMVEHFEEIAKETASKGIHFRVCFSSRHYPYIRLQRGIRLTLENQAGHSADLETYIENRLKLTDLDVTKELQGQLVAKSSGVFMWVVLVVDLLNKEGRRGGLALRRRLAALPEDLTNLFKEILKRDQESTEEFKICMMWILFSERPLAPKELYHAVWAGLLIKGLADWQIPDTTTNDTGETMDKFSRHVISCSKGLAEITRSYYPTVQFIHESVRDFLLKDRGLVELWPELGTGFEGSSHETLKQCCAVYMRHSTLRAAVRGQLAGAGADTILVRYPFFAYATEHILSHAEHAAKAYPQDQLLREFSTAEWIRASNMVPSYRRDMYATDILFQTAVRFGDRYEPDASFFYILADRGHSNLIRTLKPDLGAHAFGGMHRYPLFAALSHGYVDAAAALLNYPSAIANGVDVTWGLGRDANLPRYTSRTPLSWSAQIGRLEMVRALHRLGVNLNVKDEVGDTALLLATGNEHENVATYLVEQGADVNITGAMMETPLLVACTKGNQRLVQLMIDRGANINSMDENRNTALCKACREGARFDLTDLDGETPLFGACRGGHETIAGLLIDRGARLDSSNNRGETPFSLAHRSGSVALLELLIQKGADVHNAHPYIPLIHAASEGHHHVTELLIERGAHVNVSDPTGDTPLIRAALAGHTDLVRLLLQHGADADRRGFEGRTALLNAASVGHGAVIDILLRHGALPNTGDQAGRTAISMAARRELRLNISLTDSGGCTTPVPQCPRREGDLPRSFHSTRPQRTGDWFLRLWLPAQFGTHNLL